MLVDGNIAHFGQFKITTLWNVKNTAPYFHDNSAKDLDAMLLHYQAFFRQATSASFATNLSNQDLADIKAYLLLL
jgi:cytochrome c peroxidase